MIARSELERNMKQPRVPAFIAICLSGVLLTSCVENAAPVSKAEADLRASETIAPAAPVVKAGEIAPANAMFGTYNLRSSDCGDNTTPGWMEITETRFRFSQSQCLAADWTTRADALEVKMTCTDVENQSFGRLVKLRLSPGILQLEERGLNVSYYRCSS